jgi:hypothetical protein
MKSMGAIPVFRGSKAIVDTLRLSVKALLEGQNLLLCPDIEYKDRGANIGEIYDGFLNLEKYYSRKTGRHLPFIPLHVSDRSGCITEGNAIYFDASENFQQEKHRVYARLKQEFNRLEEL